MNHKFLTFCSCIVCKRQISVQSLNSHFLTHFKPHRGNCIICGHEVSINSKRFCSQSCAAKYSNSKKDFTKIKTGPSKKPKADKVERRKRKIYETKERIRYTKVSRCVICEKYFASDRAKVCSDKCKRTLLSELMKNKIANGFNPQKNRGRHKKSYLETSFESWLKQSYPNIVYATEYPFRRPDQNKTYFADFYFPNINLIIELDGSQHEKSKSYDLDRDNFISSEYRISILRISHKDYVKKSKLPEIMELLAGIKPVLSRVEAEGTFPIP
jgi:very-short-patch-repair endonuclease/predicted nucleic acid-binding Zn ribbon protein